MTEPAADLPAAIPMLDGLSAIADRYDGFIVDLWGTVHNGYQPLLGALDCLTALKAADKRILILSNAPRRIGPVVDRMRKVGIPDDAYDAVFSSGEAAHLALRDRDDAFHGALERACYMLGPPDDASVIEGLPYELVESVRAAHFILAIGKFHLGEQVRDYEPLLVAAAERRLPMVCANPDLEVLRGDEREICAGALAKRYEAIGGIVHYHGKPHAPIYAASLQRLGIADRARVLAIGDSLGTDVAGAAAAGIDSVLITSGIHEAELGAARFEPPNPDALLALANRKGARPTAAMVSFRW